MTAALAAALALVAAGAGRTALVSWRRSAAGRRARAVAAAPPPVEAAILVRPPAREGRAPAWLAPRLLAAGCGVPPEVAWRGWLAALLAGGGATAVVGGPGAAALAVGAMVVGPAVAWRLLRHRGDGRIEAALPLAVEGVAAALRSGASLRQAVPEAAAGAPAPVGADLAAVGEALDRGAALVDALEQWAVRRPLPGVQLVVAALSLAAETGGAAARSVDSVAATLRQRLAVRAEARALATQARMSAAVLALAPVGFCALAASLDRRSTTFLLRTPLGLALLAAGLCLDAAGALWMAHLTRAEP
ncbi:MAG TPA: type II secretion system F family protein [Acidimicrobiales bacterium]|nr:type II secretion system F family protein [Acidimicrobiales bacterium]